MPTNNKKIRKVIKERKTNETVIKIDLNIDGSGETRIKTGIDFLDHMLTELAFHGLFDLKIEAKGDTGIDIHHTNEDLGIVLGQAFKDALGDKHSIRRYGFAYAPMGSVLARAVIDISGRGELYFGTILPEKPNLEELALEFETPSGETYGLIDLKSFLESFTKHGGLTLNIGLLQCEDVHHQAEAVFKALGIALDQATQIDPRRKGVPSTKGVID